MNLNINNINKTISSFKVVIPTCALMSFSVLYYMINDNNKQISKKKLLESSK